MKIYELIRRVTKAEAELGEGVDVLGFSPKDIADAVASLAPKQSFVHGAVGTYAFLTHKTANKKLTFGADYAGSSLVPNAASSNATGATSGYTVMDGKAGKSSLSGTWRCMGARVGGIYTYVSTMFLRVL